MELTEVTKIARQFMLLHACGDCNLIFYPMPSPLGFAYRNVIGLSVPHCTLNDLNSVLDTIAHEVAHINTPSDHEHGLDWEAEARRVDALHIKSYSPEFDKFDAAYKEDRALRAAATKYLQRILDVLDQRIEAGWRAGVDYSFAGKQPENEEDRYV
jgi:hypothetical protein